MSSASRPSRSSRSTAAKRHARRSAKRQSESYTEGYVKGFEDAQGGDPVKKRSARREATRARILAAAADVFAERGFNGASVEDICDRASFTRGAFYSNFASKDDLVLELVEQHSRALLARIAAVAEQPSLSVGEILEGVFRILTEDPEEGRQWHLLEGEFALHALRDEEAGRAWAAHQAALRHELGVLVEREAAERGLELALDTDTLVRAALAIFSGGAYDHILEPEAVGPGQLERSVVPLLVAAALKAEP